MLKVATPPGSEPVSLVEAKLHLRVDAADDDDLIDDLITTARDRVETYTGRSLITQSLELWLDCFPAGGSIFLQRPPVVSITAVSYIHPTTGVLTVWDASNYRLDEISVRPRLSLEYGKSWPDVRAVTNAVKIEYSAGYGDAVAVPKRAKQAIKVLLKELYDNRSAPNMKVADVLMSSLVVPRNG